MRYLFLAAGAVFALTGLAQAGKVEVKNVHLCCPQCAKAVAAALGKVDGVADAKCDQKGRTVSFTTKDEKSTQAAIKALVDAGFYGIASDDSKAVKVETPAAKAEKADEVTVAGVHVCCKQCQGIIAPLFKDAKITYEGTGAQKDVKIAGKGLDKAAVLKTLQDAGFTGIVK